MVKLADRISLQILARIGTCRYDRHHTPRLQLLFRDLGKRGTLTPMVHTKYIRKDQGTYPLIVQCYSIR